MENKKDWFKDRGYLHLTNRTPLKHRSKILKYVSNKQKVAAHSFSPLILKELKERKYKLVNNRAGKLHRSHSKFKNGQKQPTAKLRPILYATHIDAHVYSFYTKEVLEPLYEQFLKKEPQLDNAITAYRRVKSEDLLSFKNNVHFAKDAFDEIKKRKDCVALTFDITNFFPSLCHKILRQEWARLLGTKTLPKDHYNIYKAATNYSFIKLDDLKTVNGHFDERKIQENRKNGKYSFFENYSEFLESGIQIYKNQQTSKFAKESVVGIPQGLPISAILANIYLISFDQKVVGKLVLNESVFYRRYSDDIIIVCKKSQVDYVKDFITSEIEKLELTISEQKTEEFIFKAKNEKIEVFKNSSGIFKKGIPLTYLGFEFYGNKTRIKSKNLGAFYREMKQSIKRKSKRADNQKERLLEVNKILFKRKIYRLYTYKGIKKRTLFSKKRKKDYRGNFIKYAYRASELMESPEIKKQLRNHWKILQREISKYDFDNVKNQNRPED